jgi:hypothetical protein
MEAYIIFKEKKGNAMELAGRSRWMGRLEDYYKFGSDCLGSPIFVEELFSLMTLQTYPHKNYTIFETSKRQ